MAITLRTVAGTALSHTQVDTNFCSLFYSASVSGQTLTFYKTGSAGLGVPVASSSLTLTGLNYWTASGANLTTNSGVVITGSVLNGYPGLISTANYTHVEGKGTVASADLAHAEGLTTIASGFASHAEGSGNIASATGSHAEGWNTTATGLYSHAEGADTVASGTGSHAEGSSNYAYGDFAHVEGYNNQAFGTYSHAEGYHTGVGINTAYYLTSSSLASGSFEFSSSYGDLTAYHNPGDIFYMDDTDFTGGYGVDFYTISHSLFTGGKTRIYLTDVSIVTPQAIGGNVTWGWGFWAGDRTLRADFGHSEGGGSNRALGEKSHAEGNNSEAWGNSSHAEGWQTKAIGQLSHTEGDNTTTYSAYAHAEGTHTNAIGLASHAEGFYAAATGMYSHAEGANTQTLGLASHAEGYFTVASGSYQHVQGQYNISSSAPSAFIIGNGTSLANRRNLVFASGSQFQVTGSLNVTGSLILNNSNLATTWTSYTPIWTSDGTQPVLNNGTLTGAYKLIGKTCFVRAKLTLGTTSTTGTGAWQFSLPFSASVPESIVFACTMLNDGTNWYEGTVNGIYGGFTHKTSILAPSQSTGSVGISYAVTSTAPFTWGSVDSLSFNGSYEIA